MSWLILSLPDVVTTVTSSPWVDEHRSALDYIETVETIREILAGVDQAKLVTSLEDLVSDGPQED